VWCTSQRLSIIRQPVIILVSRTDADENCKVVLDGPDYFVNGGLYVYLVTSSPIVF